MRGSWAASQDVAVTVLSNDPELTWDLCSLEADPRFQVWKVLKALRRCDALLSGGGSLLQDRTSTRSLLYYLSIIRAAELFHKPVMLYANGIGPVRKPANRRRCGGGGAGRSGSPSGTELRPGAPGDGGEAA